MCRSDLYYLILVVGFCSVFIGSNVIAAKLFYFPWDPKHAFPTGLITYPITFVITDLITEVYGEKKAQYAIYLAFFMNLLMLGLIQLAVYLPAHQIWFVEGNRYGYEELASYQTAFESVFGLSGILLFGSLLAYLCGQLIDIRLFGWIRNKTGGRHLWLRNNVSTIVSQLVDTVIVTSIYLFWGMGIGWEEGITIIFVSYCYKFLFALADTPVVYFGRWFLMKQIRSEVVYATAN
jgi:uncharacterized integral membrane protein (TIGR00697 family)